jgi:hypothetical protein
MNSDIERIIHTIFQNHVMRLNVYCTESREYWILVSNLHLDDERIRHILEEIRLAGYSNTQYLSIDEFHTYLSSIHMFALTRTVTSASNPNDIEEWDLGLGKSFSPYYKHAFRIHRIH